MYRRLIGQMAEKGITRKALASHLGTTEKTLRNKINGTTDFTWSEIIKTRDYVAPDMPLEELFENEI